MTALVALTTGRAILLGFAAGLAVFLLVAGAVIGMRRRKEPGPDIPPGMQPGPSDADLEKPLLERLLASGMLLVVFMSIWVPVVWLQEPKQNQKDTNQMFAESVARGHDLVNLNTSEENPTGYGCVRCHGTNLHGGFNMYNGNLVTVPNLQTVCGGAKYGHGLITGIQDIVTTIAQGRAGTDMVSWSVRYAGPMDDQQINDIIDYIISIQKEPLKDNLCVNPPSTTAASPSPSASASAGASSSPSASPSPSP
jgi:mono/diheme cytochrome c family protein